MVLRVMAKGSGVGASGGGFPLLERLTSGAVGRVFFQENTGEFWQIPSVSGDAGGQTETPDQKAGRLSKLRGFVA
ncbi:MAG: hypothetical protein ACJAVM_001199 [Sulfitobacter sp.]|jgi:hypothetical protein